ncbi:MAG: bifunctional nicotinamidase/pyrazinamidase [Pirellulaceae bacterium]|nr:bifunctional nicotinamidase/pyrazinamidase [Planctomycetales bacterium]
MNQHSSDDTVFNAKVALILVDIQHDFLPGGALAVPHGDEVVPVANQRMPRYQLVVATQDWHPPDHASFASQHSGTQVGDVIEWDGGPQVMWPDHCVQNTGGAQFAAALQIDRFDHIVRKGTDRRIDSYSGFFDNNHRRATGLHEYLNQRGIEELHVMGLATDYCVKFTALDAVELGYRVVLIYEGIRGVELQPGDCQRAIVAMQQHGVQLAT